MKRYFKIMVAMVAGTILGACNLDLDPRSAVTFEHFFRNEDDLFSLVAEMHGELRETMTKISHQEHMGAKIDWINGRASQYEKLRNLDPNIIASRFSQQNWKRYYNVLNLADLFMDNYKKADIESQSRLNFCLGQCEFLRAVCYMNLGRTWGDAVVTRGSLFTGKYTKTPAPQVIDTAIYYGLKAYDLLPKYNEMRGMNGKNLTSKQYGCKGSVAGVLAQLYAWKGAIHNDSKALEEAVKWSSMLIDPINWQQVGKYVMAMDPEQVCEKVMLRGSDESIFEIEVNFVETDFSPFLLATNLINFPVKRNSKPQDALDTNYGLTLSLVREMYSPNDKRRTAYFYEPDDSSNANSASLAYLYKWRNTLYREVGGGDPAQFRNLDCNKVIVRLADIYLLRAECLLRMGEVGGAQADLNVVRQRAGADLFPADGESVGDLQLLIFREREKELLLEGHRYYDIRRNGSEYIRRELSDGFRQLSDADIQNGALYLPIPQTAFTNNDVMIQNTYWLSKMK